MSRAHGRSRRCERLFCEADPGAAGRARGSQPDARHAAEEVSERATAFLDHSSSSSLLDLRVGMKDYIAGLTPEQLAAHGGLNPTPETQQKLSKSASRRSAALLDVFIS